MKEIQKKREKKKKIYLMYGDFLKIFVIKYFAILIFFCYKIFCDRFIFKDEAIESALKEYGLT